ncbi:acyl-CoA dehydrogenase family protein [Streptomyces sp. NBC_00726]|uniref:acyl-CoA dehydrogenase family protein n=1 Tax=Streptomyces sp. NBC_00726 TaxID=2903674 RepID=UPI0038649B78
MAAFLPQAGQSEVWRTGADQPIAAALMPSGTAEPVPGGWLLTGEWQFLSGVDYATWALLCVPGPAAGGKPRFMAVPRSELSVRDTWFSIGMRGTGSNSVVLETVFVPEHRSFSREALATGTPGEAAATCYRVPLLAVAGLPFAALSAGLAQSTLSRWSEWTGTRTAGPRPMRESESVRLEFARSAVENDAAQLLVERAAAVADDLGLARRHAARSARDAAHAASMSRQTVERLFVSTGTRTQRDGDVIQRAWRDVHAAASHAALRFDIHGSAYAQQEWSTKGDSDEQAG